MRAVRLHAPGLDSLTVDEVDVPELRPGEALVRVHAAALTRDELDWPLDRLPAIPSYELSGVVESVAPDVSGVSAGDAVFALTPFDRDGVAAEFAAVPAAVLSKKPRTLAHVEAAALPLAGLSAWQGLLEHGRLEHGMRVLIHGATGGVGQLALQLARLQGADVIGTASSANGARGLVDRSAAPFEDSVSWSTSSSTPSAATCSPARAPSSVTAAASSPSPRRRTA